MSQVVDRDISNPALTPLERAVTDVAPPRLFAVKQPDHPPRTEPHSEPLAPTLPETSGRDSETLILD